MKRVIFITLVLLSLSTLSATCTNIPDCLKLAEKLKNTNYVSLTKLPSDKVNLDSIDLNASNIDFYVTLILNQKGFTRTFHKDQNQYNVISARDVRYSPTFYYEDVSKVPSDYDYAMALVPLSHASAKQVVRSFRPFMSRYGRIMPLENTSSILIQDTGLNIKRLVKLIRKIDIKPADLTKEQRKTRNEEKKFHRKLRLLQAKACSEKKS